MKDFEVEYIPQSISPISKQKYFIVFVESGRSTYLKDKIFTSYTEAIEAKESSGRGVLDSFVRGCSSIKEAQSWLNRYEKWSA